MAAHVPNKARTVAPDLLSALQNLDRRVLYALLAVAVSLPFVLPMRGVKPVILPQTAGYYETIERVAADPVASKKLVLLAADFSSSTATENLNQYEATMRHVMRRKLRFAILSISDPQGRELGQQTAEKLAPEFGYIYGRDYVNWGYKAGDAALNLKALVRDIPGTIGKDIRGTPLASVPVMSGVTDVDDISVVAEHASSQTLEQWLAYFRGGDVGEPVPVLYACTAVMAPEAFPYLKSGQLQGLLNGLKGAAEYESMLGHDGFATRASNSLSFAHFLILLLLLVGNGSMLLARRGAQRKGT